MGSIFGGGGGGGGTSSQPSTVNPEVFLPQNQPGANQAWLNLMQGFYGGSQPAATSGINPAFQAWPQVQASAQQLYANPYAQQAQDAANRAAGAGLYQADSQLGPTGLGYGLGWSGGGLNQNLLQSATSPTYGWLVQQMANNPYYAQALGGAQAGAGIGGAAAGAVPGQVSQLGGLGGQEAAMAGPLSSLALGGYGQLAGLSNQLMPQALQLPGQLAGLSGQLMPQALGALGQANPMLQSQAGSIQQASQDPQGALYQRTLQQLQDQINANLASSGVGSSPYGQSVLSGGLSNFNIDWQNQQLQRQIQGGQAMQGLLGQEFSNLGAVGSLGTGLAGAQLGALQGAGSLGAGLTGAELGQLQGAGGLFNQLAQGAGGLYGQGLGLGAQGAGLAAQAAGMPSGAYQNQLQSILGAQQAQTGAALQGAQGFSPIASGLVNAATLQNLGISNLANFGALPYQTSVGQAQTGLGGLTNQIGLGSQMYSLPQQTLSNLAQYMGLGNQAAGLQGGLSQLNQPNFQGIGSLLGAGNNALFGTQGLLGGGAGLLGSAGVAPQITGDALGGTFSSGAAGSGILGFLGDLFGLGAGAGGGAAAAELALLA